MATTKRKAVKRAVARTSAVKPKLAKAVVVKRLSKSSVKPTKMLAKKSPVKKVVKKTIKVVSKKTNSVNVKKVISKKIAPKVVRQTLVKPKKVIKSVTKSASPHTLKKPILKKNNAIKSQSRTLAPKKNVIAQLIAQIDGIYHQIAQAYQSEIAGVSRQAQKIKQVLASTLKKQDALEVKIKKSTETNPSLSQQKAIQLLQKNFDAQSLALKKLEEEEASIHRSAQTLLDGRERWLAEKNLVAEHRRQSVLTQAVKKTETTSSSYATVKTPFLDREDFPIKTETMLTPSASRPLQHFQKADTAKPILPTIPNVGVKLTEMRPKTLTEKSLSQDVKKPETSDA